MCEDSEKNRLREKFTDFLNSRRLKKTPERFEILFSSLECAGHFDADILYKHLESKGYHVSKATIYNTLDLLSEARIIRKLLFDTHQARYEIAGQTHSHLICTNCGKISELNQGNFQIPDNFDLLDGFSPSYVSICIYGLCKDCNKNLNTER